jgi:pyruvate kinase
LDTLLRLIEAGMDVARINFSHGDHIKHRESIALVREASKKLGIPVGILADLQGPKIRIGKLLAPIALEKGKKLYFRGIDPTAPRVPADGSRDFPIEVSYPRLAYDLMPSSIMLLDDGIIRLKVVEKFPLENLLVAEVESGNHLFDNKGVNFQGAKLSASGITEKDWEDIQFGIENEVDFFALSFVRSAREIRYLKSYLEDKKCGIHVIAKIEKAEALQELDEIVKASDAIMVARGDLGVEIGNENVPVWQKKIIRVAHAHARPVITATQMLTSMVENQTPTRAEASDISNAVFDGSDALMLSNESSVGKYPVEAVDTMSNIIVAAENYIRFEEKSNRMLEQTYDSGAGVSAAIETAAVVLATNLKAKCLACLTRSGQSARLLAKHRPSMPIFAFVENAKVQKQLCLSWGISVVPWKEMPQQDYTIFDELLEELKRLGQVRKGDMAIMTAGIPTSRQTGSANTVVVRQYRESGLR